ncbi:flagellar hook-basal body protein [Virgibacillus ainsalahensis]
MSRMMIQAAATMNQLQNKMDSVSNNLANSQTTGYKSRQSEFSSLLYQQIDNMTAPENAQGRLTPDGVRIGSGARLASTNLNMTTGAISETGRVLDTALLEGNHFFQIQVTENGIQETRYTRDGAFYLNPVNNNQDVMLTTGDGSPVMGQNGPIVIPEGFNSIDILKNGQIVVERENQTEVAGTLAVVEAVRPRLLEAAGENSFRLPDLFELGYNADDIIQAQMPNGNILHSGALEHSNVDIGQQMADLMMAQRSYQFNSRTISMGDQMMGLVNQLRS